MKSNFSTVTKTGLEQKESNKTHRIYLEHEEYEYKCEPPNTIFDIDCGNQCSCLSNGRVGNCTLTTKGCNGWINEDGMPVYLEEETYRGDFKCIQNSRIMVECNRCMCNNDGRVERCTVMGCLSWKKYKEYSSIII